MNMKSASTLLTLISFGVLTFGQYYPGASCIIERTQTNGVCKAINQCPSVVADIRKRRRHTRCGFEGRTEIVCCPFEAPPTTTTARPTLGPNSRICERKCEEYKSAVYEYTYSLSLALGSEPNRIQVDKCGHKTIPLIVGGEFSKPREFPHMALIGFMNGNEGPLWLCGGTLISDQYVLTAGHCLQTRLYGAPQVVRLGELNLDIDTEDARPEDYTISNIIPHPEYNGRSKYNDIALLKLNRKVELSPYKRPACLPTSFEGIERTAIATGWGHTTWSGNSSNHLLKVILEKFSHAECNDTYASEINRNLKYGIVPDTQLCAGSKDKEKDTCQGDSGGPLQVYHNHQYCMYTIIGVTSFGITCGNVGVPGIYTRVYSYLDWIESIVWENDS